VSRSPGYTACAAGGRACLGPRFRRCRARGRFRHRPKRSDETPGRWHQRWRSRDAPGRWSDRVGGRTSLEALPDEKALPDRDHRRSPIRATPPGSTSKPRSTGSTSCAPASRQPTLTPAMSGAPARTSNGPKERSGHW